MRTVSVLKAALIAVMLCCFSLPGVFAQRKAVHPDSLISTKTTRTTAGISAADQKAIQEIFRGVPTSKYRLEFNSGKTVYGSQKVSMSDIQQIKRVSNPAESAGYIVLIVEGKDVIYVLAVGSDKLTSVIGREKAQKLNAIVAKYR